MPDKYWQFVPLLSTTINAIGTPVAFQECSGIKFFVKWPDNSTAGEVIIEESDDGGYAGVWSPVGSIVWGAEITKEGSVWPGPFGFVRARLINIAGTHTDPVVATAQGIRDPS